MNIEKELINEKLKNAQLLWKIKFLREDIEEIRKIYESALYNKDQEIRKLEERVNKIHDDFLMYQLEKEDNINNANEYINELFLSNKELKDLENGE